MQRLNTQRRARDQDAHTPRLIFRSCKDLPIQSVIDFPFSGAVGGIDPTSASSDQVNGASLDDALASEGAEAAEEDIDIDEALFDPDDLDDLDEELETLDIDSS